MIYYTGNIVWRKVNRKNSKKMVCSKDGHEKPLDINIETGKVH